MAGKRNKSHQNTNAAAEAVATINKEIRDQLSSNGAANNKSSPSVKPIDTVASSSVKLQPKSSNATDKTPASPWYGGSWRAKASPVAQIAKESISVSGGATSESLNDSPTKSPAPYMNSGLKNSSKSVPVVAKPTKVNAKGSNDIDKAPDQGPHTTGQADHDGYPPGLEAKTAQAQAQAPWFGWWSRPDGYANSNPDAQPPRKPSATVASPKPTTTQSQAPVETLERNADDATRLSVQVEKLSRDTPSRSWFRLWSAAQNEQAQQDPQRDQCAPSAQIATVDSTGAVNGMNERPKTPASITSNKRPKTPQRPEDAPSHGAPKSVNSTPARQSTGWAFWSSDQGPNPSTDGPQKHLGELAVADTPSQSHPEAAQFNEQGRRKSKQSTLTTTTKDSSRPSTGSLTIPLDASAPPPSATKVEKHKSEAARLAAATQALQSKLKGPPNYIMPSFASTYPPAHNPSYLERIGHFLASSLHIYDPVTTPNHVCLSPSPPKIKTAVAIGVHGYFPAAIIQKVIGQPTGTSIRFANYAADSIRWWSEQHQPGTTCEVEQIALEGEGFIADRVNTLWKLLLNWLSHLRKADLILVACHSQGVPVSVMLVAKLIELGCLGSNVRIGICAMAGVNLGPFIDFKSKFFGGSAAELFEFAKPNSSVSREYASSLDIILRHGVRVTYIGSLDDQLVSLESSLFINLSHPYVQRAVFIDGRLHAPDFISQLVAFALKLRNLGISDHGLIRELSSPLAGSIYGGEGHSRLYDDDEVYRLAIAFTLDATDIDPKTYVSASGATSTDARRRSNGGIPSSTAVANNIRRGNTSASQRPGVAPVIAAYESVSAANANPYYLPWALRGILEESAVKKDMQDEVRALIKLFDEWRPVTKMLKDVRFRLEAVKSAAKMG